MNTEFLTPKTQPLLIVISGPSGVGKDTVVQRIKERGFPFHFVVTATTRAIRPGEVDGADYIFISQDRFNEMIASGELLEHALVYGQHKGIPKQQVRDALASGKDVLMRIDVQGASTIRHLAPGALLVFLSTRNEDELIRRLKQRKTETPEGLELRLATARDELKCAKDFDYFVINADMQLDATVDTIMDIINAEHHRTHPRNVAL